MDGVKMEPFKNDGLGPLLINKQSMKSLVCQNFNLFFDAIDSGKYLGYAICQACCSYA